MALTSRSVGQTMPTSGLPQTVDVLQVSWGTTNDLGEQVATWATVSTAIGADIQPLSLQTQNALQQLNQGKAKLSSHLMFSGAVTISSGCQVVDADGNTFTVDSVQDHGSHKESILTIEGKA